MARREPTKGDATDATSGAPRRSRIDEIGRRRMTKGRSGNGSVNHPIRVFLVDDHGVVRRGMRAYLAMLDDIDVIGEASSGLEALAGVDSLVAEGAAPDVVMMDLLMPGMDGIAATARLKERHPGVAVVALTSFVGEEKVHAALEAGVAGYLLKDADADEVGAAIRAAHRGEVHLSPEAARQLAEATEPAAQTSAPVLTDREREVLALVAKGASNRKVGDALFISERTARTHVSNILMKLGLGSRVQAALWAIREGIASPND